LDALIFSQDQLTPEECFAKTRSPMAKPSAALTVVLRRRCVKRIECFAILRTRRGTLGMLANEIDQQQILLLVARRQLGQDFVQLLE
jgi:hypothetical protein